MVESTPLKLNLGCGYNKLQGFVNVDSAKDCNPDQLVDLESFPWPWDDDSVDEIRMSHVLEHLGQAPEVYLKIMCEIYRICVADAVIHITVPHHRHDNFHSDPTHVRAVTPLGLALFDRQQCEAWIAGGYSNTPLALYCGVDFVTEEVINDLDPAWQQRLQDGSTDVATIEFHAQHGSNVIAQTRFRLRVRKQVPERDSA
ncbi:class I SAM-dependent methyltransferase [Alterisphingorhabdus coralli]|uniref:Methyltransferase type 11 domain-containing protein n=1 Tax=Alterisphingorhabdus coralli TaxID=3071408 RepID=A0AA97F9N2_9SPHN|nr:hypothetical protein [Parasphingorhabdus sp. SCSIO 66989]WOE75040.1 hypothetical protein RB602_14585 [Parasphingorhabdus sp. SCSIO 66989]